MKITISHITSLVLQVSFRVTVPGLAVVKYSIQKAEENSNNHAIPVSVLLFNSNKNNQIKA